MHYWRTLDGTSPITNLLMKYPGEKVRNHFKNLPFLTRTKTHTVWKFHEFSTNQIYGKSILGIFEVQNLPIYHIQRLLILILYEFCHFLKAEIAQKLKLSLQNCKNGSFKIAVVCKYFNSLVSLGNKFLWQASRFSEIDFT